MFGFLKKKILDKAVAIQVKEISDFNLNLSRMNSDEIGMGVAQATHIRHNFQERLGVNLLEPSVALLQDASLPLAINKTIQEFQKNGNMTDAAGMMIWLHTLRSMGEFEVRPHGRELWKQLARGFPHVTESALNFEMVSGVALNFEGYNEIPQGLEPNPT